MIRTTEISLLFFLFVSQACISKSKNKDFLAPRTPALPFPYLMMSNKAMILFPCKSAQAI